MKKCGLMYIDLLDAKGNLDLEVGEYIVNALQAEFYVIKQQNWVNIYFI